ncbi:MAG: 3-dehydroquinate synthase [Acidobacteriia bacterium]|nr:3-dehydroquinate synthase [Terriglobia bacterium]
MIRVRLKERSYVAVVGRGVSRRGKLLEAILDGKCKVFLISNPRIWKLYGHSMADRKGPLAGAIPLIVPDGERFKNIRWYERLCEQVVRAGADRRSVVVALGGGVVGDLAGFVAATVLRGLALVHIPTSLLSQIDSSIGGKTGINLGAGKNLIGAFHQPRLVVIDPNLLKTLPPRELRAGLYEAVKYGAILDRPLFDFIEAHSEALQACRVNSLQEVVQRCVSIKARIVAEDEFEHGVRKLLNFGHTMGHGLEAATRYTRFKHGEAVGWGSLIAVRVAQRMGVINTGDAERMARAFASLGRLPIISDVPFEKVRTHMQHDKKAEAGNIAFVLPTAVGQGRVFKDVDLRLVKISYHEIQAEANRSKTFWNIK